MKSKLDVKAMQERYEAAEMRWLDGKRDLVTERLEAYVIRAGGCTSCSTEGGKK